MKEGAQEMPQRGLGLVVVLGVGGWGGVGGGGGVREAVGEHRGLQVRGRTCAREGLEQRRSPRH